MPIPAKRPTPTSRPVTPQPKSRRKSSFLRREASHGTPSRQAHNGTASSTRATRGTRLWPRAASAATCPATRPKSSPRPEGTSKSQPAAPTTIPPANADATIPANIAAKASNTRLPGVGVESSTDTVGPSQSGEIDAARRSARGRPGVAPPKIAPQSAGRRGPSPAAVASDQREPCTNHGSRENPQHAGHRSTQSVAHTRRTELWQQDDGNQAGHSDDSRWAPYPLPTVETGISRNGVYA